MEYHIRELLDHYPLQQLFEAYCQSVGISVSIVDLEGEFLLEANWHPVCTGFFRKHPATRNLCIQHDAHLAGKLKTSEKKRCLFLPQWPELCRLSAGDRRPACGQRDYWPVPAANLPTVNIFASRPQVTVSTRPASWRPWIKSLLSQKNNCTISWISWSAKLC